MLDKHPFKDKANNEYHPSVEGESLSVPKAEQEWIDENEFKRAERAGNFPIEGDGHGIPGQQAKPSSVNVEARPTVQDEVIPDLTDREINEYFNGGELKNPAELLERLLNRPEHKE